MSRAYRVTAALVEDAKISGSDSITGSLRVMSAGLACGEVAAVVESVLRGRGYTVVDGKATKTIGGVDLVVDVAEGEATATVAVETSKNIEVTGSGSAYDDVRGSHKAAEAAAAADAARKMAAAKETATAEATAVASEQLKKALPEIQAEIDAVGLATTKGCMTRRAGQLGRVTSVTDQGAGGATIEIEV